MAVVQDGAATAARAGKPLCAAAVSVSAVCTDLRWVNCAMVQAVRESPVGSARRSPTVEHHPVGDSVTAVARVVRAVEATPDFCGELSLLIGITGRKVSPCGRGDETGEADGFGIDRREQPGGAERRRLGARRDEDLGAAGPVAVNTDAVFPPLRPEVAAEQEPGQHRVVGGARAVAAQQPQVVSLRTDDVVEAGQGGGGLVDVRRPDPVAVAGYETAGGNSGSFRINNVNPGMTYTVKVQGCDRDIFGSSTCTPWYEDSITTASALPYGPDTCKQGFVWREAQPSDHVCVTPDIRTQTAQENSFAAARRDPNGGAYGPDTCLVGFVWREAFSGDHVCVPPDSRSQAAADNAAAPSRGAA